MLTNKGLLKRLWWPLVVIICLLVFIITLQGKHYLIFSFGILIASMLPFFVRFEQRPVNARELVFIATLAAIAAIIRIPFAAIPSVQPTSFVIIVAALVMGPESGFIIGSTTAIVSNMFLGQGPWTPWQMFGWGMMGLFFGFLANTRVMNNRYLIAIMGFGWGFIFGWIMDLWTLLAFISPVTWVSTVATFGASFIFDLLHGLSNFVLLLLFYPTWYRILNRFKLKYGLLVNMNKKE